jgi:hypothetical protein
MRNHEFMLCSNPTNPSQAPTKKREFYSEYCVLELLDEHPTLLKLTKSNQQSLHTQINITKFYY